MIMKKDIRKMWKKNPSPRLEKLTDRILTENLYRRMSYIIPAPEPTYSEYQLKDIPKDTIGKQ
jgi:hypothetical protein